jgi:hypothetical protein
MSYYQSMHTVSFRIAKTISTASTAIVQGQDVSRQSDGPATLTITPKHR